MRTNTMKRIGRIALVLLCSVAAFANPGDKTSYTASAKFAASSTTDNAVINGNATTLVQVTEIDFSCTETTAGIVTFTISKRSTADTGGTSANLTAVPDDSAYPAAVSVAKTYTGTGPTAGTAVGNVDNEQVGCPAPGTATDNVPYVWRPANAIKLHGTAEGLAVTVGGALTGGNITYTVKWTETSTQ